MSRKIVVDYLARVEGEAALSLVLSGDQVTSAELRIFEPPRFFEAFLRGRDHEEAPDFTARICGICPVAYQMSACHAIEDALGVRVEGELRRLRRLMYCGEWIESHTLHIFMLHAPDFFGFEDSLALAKVNPEIVKDGLQIKKAGNAIVRVLGGREIHPINVRVGGFYRVPRREELTKLLPQLEAALERMERRTVEIAGLARPDVRRDYEFVSLAHPDEYPFNEGRVVSNAGLDISVAAFDQNFEEEHVAYTNALRSRRVGRGAYFCGPLARINNNFERLGEAALRTAAAARFTVPCANPFASIVARGIEVVQALDEAIRIIRSYARPSAPAVDYEIRAGTGYGATEAPRGLLYHRYTLDEEGLITDAKIVPPTSQNQRVIEEDLAALGPKLAALPQEAATLLAEQAIRNYDPCISCATHFLKLKIERSA